MSTTDSREELEHLDDFRRVLKWCYDHGILKGEFPESGNKKAEVIDMAEKRLMQLIDTYAHQREVERLKSLLSKLPERDNSSLDAAYNGGATKDDYRTFGSNAMLGEIKILIKDELVALTTQYNKGDKDE